MVSSNVYYDFNWKQEINLLPTEAFICLCQTVLQEGISRSHMGNTWRFPQTKDVDDDLSLYNAGGIIIRKLITSILLILVVLLLYLCNHVTKVNVSSKFFLTEK